MVKFFTEMRSERQCPVRTGEKQNRVEYKSDIPMGGTVCAPAPIYVEILTSNVTVQECDFWEVTRS